MGAAISFADFPHKGNYTSDRIYFMHPEKNIVFHMYDDRPATQCAPASK
ncbi:DUF3885 domain-containing protein [Paenibacillus antri]